MAGTVVYALLGGILPSLIWLAFWLREDAARPEPKGRLAETFLAGMLMVIAVLPFQKMAADRFPGFGFEPFLLWAVIEEVFKFGAAYAVAIASRDSDEPIDPLIYMITAALGFAALENALFLWDPLLQKDIALAFSTGGMRFLGASLLHVVSSGAVGGALALAFYKPKVVKLFYAVIGLGAAIAMHTAFNLLLIDGNQDVRTFSAVWVAAAGLLILFEAVKSIAPKTRQAIIDK